ncbi:unnamed protein product [Didymodactylos carnosus]|uniref:Integrase zinc-binding domain-containing protein n=1 Tax=Didymodactylos carnosus TaxID=1234261 RepID=A0A8S2GYS1_9BILA|nr:unnamed protein product [Didymodactylos carnosus]CAF3577030.1 unnamed protein product [Didymodactylos carnosus]
MQSPQYCLIFAVAAADLALYIYEYKNAQFKFWAKKNFEIIKIEDKSIIYSIKEKRSVVTYENLFDKLNECHTAVGHLGRDKTWNELLENQIVSLGFMTRMQMDLTDMRNIKINFFEENDANNSAIPDIEGIMLEENLPLDAATLFEEFDKTVSQSDTDNDDLLYNHNKSDNDEDNDNYNSVINYPVDDIIQNSHQNAIVDAEENMNNNDDPITWLNSIIDSSDKDRVIQYGADSSS